MRTHLFSRWHFGNSASVREHREIYQKGNKEVSNVQNAKGVESKEVDPKNPTKAAEEIVQGKIEEADTTSAKIEHVYKESMAIMGKFVTPVADVLIGTDNRKKGMAVLDGASVAVFKVPFAQNAKQEKKAAAPKEVKKEEEKKPLTPQEVDTRLNQLQKKFQENDTKLKDRTLDRAERIRLVKEQKDIQEEVFALQETRPPATEGERLARELRKASKEIAAAKNMLDKFLAVIQYIATLFEYFGVAINRGLGKAPSKSTTIENTTATPASRVDASLRENLKPRSDRAEEVPKTEKENMEQVKEKNKEQIEKNNGELKKIAEQLPKAEQGKISLSKQKEDLEKNKEMSKDEKTKKMAEVDEQIKKNEETLKIMKNKKASLEQQNKLLQEEQLVLDERLKKLGGAAVAAAPQAKPDGKPEVQAPAAAVQAAPVKVEVSKSQKRMKAFIATMNNDTDFGYGFDDPKDPEKIKVMGREDNLHLKFQPDGSVVAFLKNTKGREVQCRIPEKNGAKYDFGPDFDAIQLDLLRKVSAFLEAAIRRENDQIKAI